MTRTSDLVLTACGLLAAMLLTWMLLEWVHVLTFADLWSK